MSSIPSSDSSIYCVFVALVSRLFSLAGGRLNNRAGCLAMNTYHLPMAAFKKNDAYTVFF